MYYTATAEVKIGKITLKGVTEAEFETSVDTIGGTAKITIPRRITRKDGKTLLDQIHTGDSVTLKHPKSHLAHLNYCYFVLCASFFSRFLLLLNNILSL